VYEIPRELLNRFAPNSQGRLVSSFTETSLKVKGQGHQRQQKWHFSALSAACVWFMFGKTSLAVVLLLPFEDNPRLVVVVT